MTDATQRIEELEAENERLQTALVNLSAITMAIIKEYHGSSVSIQRDTLSDTERCLDIYKDPTGEMIVIEIKEE